MGRKRAFDLALASLVLLLAVLPLLVAAIAIKLDSRGPVLFRQERVGLGGRRFTLLKLRTMVVDGDDSEQRRFMSAVVAGEARPDEGLFKLARDLRVTRVGRTLRRFSLDELPQLVNVLRGEMSLVGPRPPLPFEVELYDDLARRRLDALPGMTGLWQVSGRARLPFQEQVVLDLAYLERASVAEDVRILLRTPKVVLSGDGAA
jgi:lipopolysaccharide/colanic/teichoic acid biosynthesis glycosyltransferase